jgi:hypothetical protein
VTGPFETFGPIGLPMLDVQAKQLDQLLKDHPDAQVVRRRVESAKSETNPGERSDVSWITTEALDRDLEIVKVGGFRDDHFRLNPVVTLNHNYDQPPVGKSTWRKALTDGDIRGIKAKTVYPRAPESFQGQWPADIAFDLVQSGLMVGKSIGFIALKSHPPTQQDIDFRPETTKARRIIDDWLLLEYACTWLPANQEAITLAIQKHAQRLPFTSWKEIERRLERAISEIDLDSQIREAYNRILGRV